mmetsp:Transcript_27676/g.33661  ORF Transcript_27676/g.33661 Transcript_27676/m.33661 type:complete len:137 (+) Transcript_27676:1802-2212(+)
MMKTMKNPRGKGVAVVHAVKDRVVPVLPGIKREHPQKAREALTERAGAAEGIKAEVENMSRRLWMVGQEGAGEVSANAGAEMIFKYSIRCWGIFFGFAFPTVNSQARFDESHLDVIKYKLSKLKSMLLFVATIYLI